MRKSCFRKITFLQHERLELDMLHAPRVSGERNTFRIVCRARALSGIGRRFFCDRMIESRSVRSPLIYNRRRFMSMVGSGK